MPAYDVTSALRDKALLWSLGFASAADVVSAACDVISAGEGGMAMAMLAGVHHRWADEEAPELMPDALAEVGMPFFPRGSQAAKGAGLAQMAGRVLAGELKPRELTAWAHGVIGHDGGDIGQSLVSLDDQYQLAYAVAEDNGSEADTRDLDTEVMAGARRLIEHSLGDAESIA